MTKASLNLDQRRLVEIIEAIDFGAIEQLSIRGGLPCFDPRPRVIQAIKLAPGTTRQPDRRLEDLTLKTRFEELFDHLARFGNAVVNIEVQHSLPFRIVVERHYEELL
jgi:hypothetical protein